MDAPVNPLLTAWEAPFGLPPFELVRPEHFKPAFERGMREHRQELAQIGAQPEAPSFDNTMARFDASGRLLSRVNRCSTTWRPRATSDALQAVQRDMAPRWPRTGARCTWMRRCSRVSTRCTARASA